MAELNPMDNKLPTTKTTAPVILGCIPVRGIGPSSRLATRRRVGEDHISPVERIRKAVGSEIRARTDALAQR